MDVKLVPGWLGKINWSRGLPTLPDKFNLDRDKNMDYWGTFKLYIYDDVKEYIKFISNKNSSYYNAHIAPWQSYDMNIREWSSASKKQNKHSKNNSKNKTRHHHNNFNDSFNDQLNDNINDQLVQIKDDYLDDDDTEIDENTEIATTDMPLSLNEL